jgi:hypothetical protein
MVLSHPEPIFGCQRFRLGQGLVIQFVEDDAFLADVGEEILPLLQVGVHLPPGMDDEAHWGRDRLVMDQPVGGLVPVFGKVAELAVVDDDQKIEIGAIAFHGEGLVDPAALGIGAEQDDLQNPAALLELGRALLQRILELLMQDLQLHDLIANSQNLPLMFAEQTKASLIGERSAVYFTAPVRMSSEHRVLREVGLILREVATLVERHSARRTGAARVEGEFVILANVVSLTFTYFSASTKDGEPAWNAEHRPQAIGIKIEYVRGGQKITRERSVLLSGSLTLVP